MKKVVILGAGPAGLSAAYKLSGEDTQVVIIEKDSQVGGISKTIEKNGNYFDLGGHRFFTKIDKVNILWEEILGAEYRTRPRLSRIYYRNKYFNYPLKPANALLGVGVFNAIGMVVSYINSQISPKSKEKSFEDWVSNRFGKKLYNTFFKTYTEKVWGIPCNQISSEWAAQRIKGLSLKSAIINSFIKSNNNIKTLVDEFKYPDYGPGMMYSKMLEKAEQNGAKCLLDARVSSITHDGKKVKSISYIDKNGNEKIVQGSQFISSIPVTELIQVLKPAPNAMVLEAAARLRYRSFITIGLELNQEKVFPDNWIYIHSPEVKLGRIQNFKNWSPLMVKNPDHTALGLEYFCDEDDDFWKKSDEELFNIAIHELEKIKIAKKNTVIDYLVYRVPKAYPVYMNGYEQNINIIKQYLNGFENIQPVGRYGMFKYNNMDHSILTGLLAADNILTGARHDIWGVNTEEEYHEAKNTLVADERRAVV